MSDPKRYAPSGPCKYMTEDPYGNWVDLVEHDHLKAECDALRAENERLRKVTHVMIPTDTMEQEFAKYHRRGFDAGIKQGLAENAELVAALIEAQKIINHQGWSANEQPAYDFIDAALAKHRGE